MREYFRTLLIIGLAVPAGVAVAADGAPDLEARLAAAQARLEQAANEIAEISTRLGEPVMRPMIMHARAVPRPLIGVQFDPASGADGVRVLSVSPGGPAADGGVRPHDLIVAVNGESMVGRKDPARDATAALRGAPAGQPLKLRVMRDGKPLEMALTPRPLGDTMIDLALPEPVAATMPMPPAPPIPPGAFAWQGGLAGRLGGLEFATLTPELGEYFGTDKGVLVVRVPKSGALGLREGDVIESIGGREPTSAAHATRILASYQAGETVPIRGLRKHKALVLTASLPK